MIKTVRDLYKWAKGIEAKTKKCRKCKNGLPCPAHGRSIAAIVSKNKGFFIREGVLSLDEISNYRDRYNG